jgi:dimethylglycine dehydrogenase
MWSCDPRRFTGFADQEYANAKGIEIYSHEYAIHFPHYQWPAGRKKRVSPLYPTLAGLGAQFMAAAGWERAAWYARAGDDTGLDSCATYEREGPWFAAVGEECLAVRDTVGICELPGFSRFHVSGAGAADWLNTLITGSLPRIGRVALAYFADRKGRIVTEMSLARLDHDEFLLLTAASAEWHDRDWLLQHLPADGSIRIENLSEADNCLVVSGPQSRALLAGLCTADLSLPWLSHQQSEIAGVAVRLMRVSYVGELGWEIHCPLADTVAVFEAVRDAGRPLGLRAFGMYAMDALRIEKGYRSWKQDLSTDYTVLEAGLERFVRFDKADFIGREALLKQHEQVPKQRCVTLTVDTGTCEAPYLAGVWHGERRVGLVTSGNYGYRVGQSIALAVIDRDCSAPGCELSVGIFGERRRAVVAPQSALYDPANSRLRS